MTEPMTPADAMHVLWAASARHGHRIDVPADIRAAIDAMIIRIAAMGLELDELSDDDPAVRAAALERRRQRRAEALAGLTSSPSAADHQTRE